MKVNWFTVIAQAVNFLILVWLLRRYLYNPILKAVDEREKKIKTQLDDAELHKTEALKEQDEFRKRNEQLEQQRSALMDEIVSESNIERDKLLDEARKDAVAERAKLAKALVELRQDIGGDVRQKVQQEVLAIARQTLVDLASSDLEAQVVKKFVSRINQLNNEEKHRFVSSFQSSSNELVIRSAFDLSPEYKDQIVGAISGVLRKEVEMRFETKPDLISGIELSTNGYKVSWSVAEYLDSLEKSISGLIKDKLNVASENNQNGNG